MKKSKLKTDKEQHINTSKKTIFVPVEIYPLGENAVCLEWGNQIDELIHSKVMSAYEDLKSNPFESFLEAVPAYSTLTVFYDVLEIKKNCGEKSAFDFIKNKLTQRFENLKTMNHASGRELIIPVCYDPEFGIDLNEISVMKKISIEEIIRLHAERSYHVFMIGFLPGFPYLGIVDERISVARKPNPRIHVESGSVGIARNQTGIYPFNSPGGWQIIGRTPLQLFNINKNPPALFQGGDQVRFEKITRKDFDTLKKAEMEK